MILKLIFTITLSFISFTYLQAQVTIGSNIAPPQGAVLNIQTQPDQDPTKGGITSNKGLLFPRVALISVDSLTPIVTGTLTDEVKKSYKGLIVYNVSSAVEGQGVRVWDGTQWLKMLTSIPPAQVITSNLHNLIGTYTCATGGLGAAKKIMPFGTIQPNGTYAIEIEEEGSYTFSLRLYGRSLSMNAVVGNLNFYAFLMANGVVIDAVEYPVATAAYGKNGTVFQHYAGITLNLTAKSVSVGAKITIAINTGVFYYNVNGNAMSQNNISWIWNGVANDNIITSPVRSSLFYYKL